MLTHPTLDKLATLRLHGMLSALKQQRQSPEIERLSFEERLGLLVDCELTEREDRRLKNRLRSAKLRQQACLEDLDLEHDRGIDRSLIHRLATGDWIKRKYNVLITGPTGVGKSYLACALAHKACLLGHRALYQRLTELLAEMKVARGDGRYRQHLRRLQKVDVLVVDDWGLTPLRNEEQRDLLELMEQRYSYSSTVITSQFPVEKWHSVMSDPTLADAILDRLVHNAYRLPLEGDSMRKRQSDLTQTGHMRT